MQVPCGESVSRLSRVLADQVRAFFERAGRQQEPFRLRCAAEEHRDVVAVPVRVCGARRGEKGSELVMLYRQGLTEQTLPYPPPPPPLPSLLPPFPLSPASSHKSLYAAL